MNNFKKTICNIVDEYQHNFEEISNYLFNNPELGGEEFLSAKCIVDTLKSMILL